LKPVAWRKKNSLGVNPSQPAKQNC
jgi:hypothetical protein